MSRESILTILEALGCNPPPGRWVTVRCPVHGDRSPSLGVKVGDRGLILKCHAGCAAEDIVACLGFTMPDLFFETFDARPLPDLAELSEMAARRASASSAPY